MKKNNRQSVIRDFSQTQAYGSKIKDKSKSRINYIDNEDMKEDLKEDIKEDEFKEESNITPNKKESSVTSKKSRKPLMKEVPGYPNELSSQRTDKNLLLKQNMASNKLSEKNSNLDDLIPEEVDEKINIKPKNKLNNYLETSGKFGDEKKEKKNERNDTISSWGEEEGGEEEGTEDDKKEINKKWYKPFYLTNLAMKLNHGANAVKHCDEMITLCDEALNLDQIKIILAANSLYINQLRKSQRGLVKLLMEEKEAKNLIYEIKANKEKAIIERSEKFIKLINEYILSKNTLSKEHQALFLKTKADYYRYLAEVTHDHELFINKQNALHFYMEAKHLTKDLDNLNAIKLDIALNYSVFLNEIMNKRINSYFAAKEAVFNALSDLKNCDETQLGDEQMRDSLICIEILNRNVEEWYNEEMEADNEEAERKKRELVDKANEKNNIDNIEENKKEEEDEDMIKDEDEEEEGLEGILEVGEKEKEDLPLIKDEENKKE